MLESLRFIAKVHVVTINNVKGASITAGYTERFHGSTNQTSDHTASIAVYNTDMVNMRMSRLLKRLPRLEQRLIECRYMGTDSDYIADYNVLQRATEPVDE
ncbi:hypothetical protein YDYSY3_35690 [Paenibacillus chitinolyticus]|uniref:hypothetical protein n=1 Tax=Paenibacillus chitinolyticus TaxID=79263 RepID=UPI0026E4F7C4|nr:hypothetical protein [Paenibacillus chitinolyticus]GKS12569.1 hypothetical protein YDYSY3_35690 [Paenibacillus chitinolyticus]